MSIAFIVWGVITLIILLFLLHSVYKLITYSPLPEEQARQSLEEMLSEEDPNIRADLSLHLYKWEISIEKSRLKDRILDRLEVLLAAQLSLFIIHPTLSEFFKRHWELVLFVITMNILMYVLLRIITHNRRIHMQFYFDHFLLEETLENELKDPPSESEQQFIHESKKEVYDEQ